MPAKQLSQPTIEPVSLEKMKAYLKLDHDRDDLMLSAFLIAARVHLENVTKRHFITQSWRLSLKSPCATSISLPLQPVQRILAVALKSPQGTMQTLDTADFRLDTSASPTSLILQAPSCWTKGSSLQLDLETGFGPASDDVPAPIRQAIKILAAEWYEKRLVADPETLPHINATLMTLLSPYRVLRLQ